MASSNGADVGRVAHEELVRLRVKIDIMGEELFHEGGRGNVGLQ